MTKLVNSPFFPQDFADYLTESGFTQHTCDNGSLSYAFLIPHDKLLIVVRDHLELSHWHEGDDDRKPGWVTSHRFDGIATLGFFEFSLILHAIGAVSIKDNFRKTNDSPVPAYPMNPLFKTLERFAV